MMEKKKDLKLEIIEIFMAKAGNDWSRCFHGTIKRETDADGNPFVIGKIKVLDGFICAQAKDQWILGSRLDELVKMVLDEGLHDYDCETWTILESPLALN